MARPHGHPDNQLIGSIASNISWANTEDRAKRTAPARAALDAKFLEQADGDPVRAEHLRKAHFKRLALKSAQARRRKGGDAPPGATPVTPDRPNSRGGDLDDAA